MAKNYLDKTGLNYFYSKIKNLIPTKTSQLTNDSGFATIVESGTTDDGSYIKYSDGYMEVHQTVKGTTNISTAWGSLYISGNIRLPNYPVSFIERPTTIISGQPQSGTQFFLVGNGNSDDGDSAHAGTTALGRPNSRTNVAYTLDVIAKGKWKN